MVNEALVTNHVPVTTGTSASFAAAMPYHRRWFRWDFAATWLLALNGGLTIYLFVFRG